jgi:hypothetical protein
MCNPPYRISDSVPRQCGSTIHGWLILDFGLRPGGTLNWQNHRTRVGRLIDIEVLIAKHKTAVRRSKNLCEISRGLWKESKALVQTARLHMMDMKIAQSMWRSRNRRAALLVFPSKKPLKRAA